MKHGELEESRAEHWRSVEGALIYALMNQLPNRPNTLKPADRRRALRKAFPQPAFKEAGNDLKSVFSRMDRRRWLFLGLSCAMTFALIYGFLLDSDLRKLGPGPQLIFVESWSNERSDAEIKAQQQRDASVKRKQEEYRREQFQALEKKLGMD